MDTIYKIGVEIALAGTLAQGLTSIGGQLAGLHGQIGKIEKAFGGWGGALASVGAILAGGAIIKGIDGILDATKELSHELVQIEKLGLVPGQMAGLREAAINVTRTVPGTTEKSALSVFGETFSMLGYDEAIKALPQLSRFAQVLGNTTGDYEGANHQLFQMIRSADLIGRLSDPTTKQLDPERLQHFLDIATKVAEATHGQFGPQQWLGIAQQGGPSLRGLTDEGLIGQAIIGQAMGAQRAGTASMSMFQQFAGGTMFTRNAEALQALGLLKSGDWRNDHGRVVITDNASRSLMDKLKLDPLKFINDTLLPAMRAHGINNIDDQIREIYRLFGRQTTQRMTADEISNIKQMLTERERIGAALGVGQAADIQNIKDISAAMNNLSASFTNLKTAIGGSENENIVRVINNITALTNGLTTFARDMKLGKLVGDLLPGGGGPIHGLADLVAGFGKLSGLPLQPLASGIDRIATSIGNLLSVIPKIWSKIGIGSPANSDVASEMGRQSFIPKPDTKIVAVKPVIMMDGKSVAACVMDNLDDLHLLPLGAPSPNNSGTYVAPDNNFNGG